MPQTVKGRVTLTAPCGALISVETRTNEVPRLSLSVGPGKAVYARLDTLTAIRLAEALTTFVAKRIPQETDAAMAQADEANAQVQLDSALCDECEGTGRGRGWRDSVICPTCNGHGRGIASPSERCGTCHGEGRVAPC